MRIQDEREIVNSSAYILFYKKKNIWNIILYIFFILFKIIFIFNYNINYFSKIFIKINKIK
jgi:hypothetical protein